MNKMKQFFSRQWVRLAAMALLSVAITAVVAVSGKMSTGRERSGLYYEATGLAPDGVLMEVNGEPITVEEYLYWVANDCGYLINYYGIEDLNTRLTDEMTYADYIRSDVLITEKLYGATRAWAKSLGITLTDTQRSELAEQRQAYIDYYGSEEAYLQQLELLGISEECFDRINETPYLYTSLIEACCDPASPLYPGESTLQAFAKDNQLMTVRVAYLTAEADWGEEELAESEEAMAAYAEKLRSASDKEAVLAEMADTLGVGLETLTFAPAEGDEISDSAAALSVGQSSDVINDGVDFLIVWRQEVDLTQTAGEYANRLIEEKRDSASVIFNSELYDAIDIAAFYPALVELQSELSELG